MKLDLGVRVRFGIPQSAHPWQEARASTKFSMITRWGLRLTERSTFRSALYRGLA